LAKWERERERERELLSLEAWRCRVQFRVLNSQFHHHQTFWCSIENDLLSVLVRNKHLLRSLSISSWWIVSSAHVFRLST
jgi:hypothetical protein